MADGGFIFGNEENVSRGFYDRSEDWHSIDTNIVVVESDKRREYFNKGRSNGDKELVNGREVEEDRAMGGNFDGDN